MQLNQLNPRPKRVFGKLKTAQRGATGGLSASALALATLMHWQTSRKWYPLQTPSEALGADVVPSPVHLSRKGLPVSTPSSLRCSVASSLTMNKLLPQQDLSIVTAPSFFVRGAAQLE